MMEDESEGVREEEEGREEVGYMIEGEARKAKEVVL